MLEEPLLDARLRINCWTTAFSLALVNARSDPTKATSSRTQRSIPSHLLKAPCVSQAEPSFYGSPRTHP